MNFSLPGDLSPDRLLSSGRFFSAGKWQDKAEILRDCKKLFSALADTPHEQAILSCEGEYCSVVALFALLSNGKPILMPQNLQQDNVLPLLADEVLLVDDAFVRDNLSDRSHPGLLPAFRTCTPLTLFTSGSTGKPKKVEKTCADLLHEVANLQSLWPLKSGNVVMGTVSHLHIYGLLFRILWPVFEESDLVLDCIQYQEELSDKLNNNAVLVSSPAFLSRLDHQIKSKITPVRIFSSGGALSEKAATETHRILGKKPIEVYGSTESGGIAWRVQNEQGVATFWELFKGLEVTCGGDNQLIIEQGYFDQSHSPLLMDDRVDILANRKIRLLGRADRTVKVFEKRLNLTQMEQSLVKLELIDECRCLLNGNRIATFCVLSEAGAKILAEHGKLWLVEALRHSLSGKFERVTLPKKWRFVETIPLNHQGKIDDMLLQREYL